MVVTGYVHPMHRRVPRLIVEGQKVSRWEKVNVVLLTAVDQKQERVLGVVTSPGNHARHDTLL